LDGSSKVLLKENGGFQQGEKIVQSNQDTGPEAGGLYHQMFKLKEDFSIANGYNQNLLRAIKRTII
jgi:hypothetical protein